MIISAKPKHKIFTLSLMAIHDSHYASQSKQTLPGFDVATPILL